MSTMRTAGLLAVLALFSASCTHVVDGDVRASAGLGKAEQAADASGDASACNSVDVPLTDIPAHDRTDPVLRIPQPAGWERSTKMDSELLRFLMGSRSGGGGVDSPFSSSAVVTLESIKGDMSPDELFAEERKGIEQGLGATDVQFTEHSQCGLPGEMISYVTPQMGNVAPHPGRVLCLMMNAGAGLNQVGCLSVQSTTPDDPTYQKDAEAILTGFQMLPPAKG